MWRSKKFILAALLATLVVLGGTAVALAQTENEDESQPKTLVARVAEKLGVEEQELRDAFAEARSEMRAEALDRRLQYLVEQGNITQDEADQYKEWREARPEIQLQRSLDDDQRLRSLRRYLRLHRWARWALGNN